MRRGRQAQALLDLAYHVSENGHLPTQLGDLVSAFADHRPAARAAHEKRELATPDPFRTLACTDALALSQRALKAMQVFHCRSAYPFSPRSDRIASLTNASGGV